MGTKAPIYLVIVLMSLFIVACGDSGDSGEQSSEDQPALVNVFANSDGVIGRWRLLTVETRDAGEQVIPTNDTYRVEFTENGALEGIADCNYFHGTYTTNDDDQLRVGPLEQTRAACDLPSYWHRYLAVLQSALRYERMGDRLIVHSTLSAQLVFGPAQQSE